MFYQTSLSRPTTELKQVFNTMLSTDLIYLFAVASYPQMYADGFCVAWYRAILPIAFKGYLVGTGTNMWLLWAF